MGCLVPVVKNNDNKNQHFKRCIESNYLGSITHAQIYIPIISNHLKSYYAMQEVDAIDIEKRSHSPAILFFPKGEKFRVKLAMVGNT